MLGFGETSSAYKTIFAIAMTVFLVYIGSLLVPQEGVSFAAAGAVGISFLIFLHLFSWFTGNVVVGETFKYLMILILVLAVIIPIFTSGMTTKNHFMVVKRGNSERIVFDYSVILPYLDKVVAEIGVLRWERKFGEKDGVTVTVMYEFRPTSNKDLIRKLVEKHNGNERKIVDEIEEIVEPKLDTI